MNSDIDYNRIITIKWGDSILSKSVLTKKLRKQGKVDKNSKKPLIFGTLTLFTIKVQQILAKVK